MARAVVPRTAAAVDHADTELIGQSGRRISLWCFLLYFPIILLKESPEFVPSSVFTPILSHLLHVPRFFTALRMTCQEKTLLIQ